MPTRFHEATLDELRRAHEPDQEALEALEVTARTLGVTLPAAFVEWYGIAMASSCSGSTAIPTA